MMAKSSLRSVYDLMAGDRVATVMGYLSDVPSGMGYLSEVPAGI
jgi:hypothetical protein